MYNTTTHQAAQIFNVTAQTIRRWVDEFGKHLSPSATPQQGRSRILTAADMEVLALVAELKGQGKVYEDIHASLAAGMRGDPPLSAQSPTLATLPNSDEVALLVQRIQGLQAELDEERQQRIAAEVDKGRAQGREQILRERILQLEQEVAQLRGLKN